MPMMIIRQVAKCLDCKLYHRSTNGAVLGKWMYEHAEGHLLTTGKSHTFMVWVEDATNSKEAYERNFKATQERLAIQRKEAI